MAALHHHHHHIKAPTPTWLLIKATPPPRRDAAKNPPAPAYSPLLLSPSVWQKAQNDKKSKADGRDHAGRAEVTLPASPRISCMGQVKGRRRCSSARGPAARVSGYGIGKLAWFVIGLFGRRRCRTSRACSKVRDLPSGSSSSSSYCGGGAAPAVRAFDPPLPVLKRPARDDNAPSLWERRRGGGGGKARRVPGSSRRSLQS